MFGQNQREHSLTNECGYWIGFYFFTTAKKFKISYTCSYVTVLAA